MEQKWKGTKAGDCKFTWYFMYEIMDALASLSLLIYFNVHKKFTAVIGVNLPDVNHLEQSLKKVILI